MRLVVGIDEVGRGPLAGPVTICVVACRQEIYRKIKNSKDLPNKGIDSKKLKTENREKYSDFLKNLKGQRKISYSICHISNKIIDSRGISFCIRKAIEKGIKDLDLDPKETMILLDGGLKAPETFLNQTTIIRGDEKEKIIAWASILAKVSRDNLMKRLGKKIPEYGFEKHKGYGTKNHIKAIKQNGFSLFHRQTFCRSIDVSM